jgi:hypothetical protein
MTAATA